MKRKIVVMFGLILLVCCLIFTGCTSEVKDKELSITFQDEEYSGLYTGTCEGNIPNGQGIFKYKEGDKYLNYKGDFKDGQFSGQGTFKAVDNDDDKYTYEGQWKNGTFNGKGTKKWDNDEYISYIGNFQKGVFVPDFIDLLISFGTDTTIPYTMSDKAYDFLVSHTELFPADSYEKLTPFVNNSIEYKHLSKSSEQYGDQIVVMSGKVNEIYEYVRDDSDAKYSATEIYLVDDNYNYYCIYYPGTCDLFEDDYVTIYGIPLGSSSYENIGGGTTLVQVMAGCYMEE